MAALIRNLGTALTILARQDAAEAFMHADVDAFNAPSECHTDVRRGEAKRYRRARKHAEAVAGRPFRVIIRQARVRGCPIGSPRWDRLVGAVYARAGYPF